LDMDFIKENWKESCNESFVSGGALWDSRSSTFGTTPVPDPATDVFAGLLEEVCGLDPDSTECLDIGCGAGQYSVFLAGRSRRVVGVDVSPGMISRAERLASDNGIPNARFRVADWLRDPPEAGDGQVYDVVIARMTPAVSSYGSFSKMVSSCRGHGFLTKYLRRDDIRSRVYGMMGPVPVDQKDDVSFAVNMLWNMGYDPQLRYERRRHRSEHDAGALISAYMLEAESVGSDPETAASIRSFLESLSEGGVIEEDYRADLVTVYWEGRIPDVFPTRAR